MRAQEIGKVIADKRVKAGLTQEQVGEKLGIGNEAVSRMERGVAPPSVSRLYDLAKLFDCGVADFFLVGSALKSDQAQRIVQILEPLGLTDRRMLIEGLAHLAQRLAKRPIKEKDKDWFAPD
ncbi:helix-turn-helix domain-containing protein [Ralstonia sp. A12]|uniref:helix-turn-helix domain-containing protein n=1 Tax=Ralstonia sp. A12 TaxID=1217052 RepID=UPI0006948AE2|nr:helix-turn-helix transcriptional regulator [Ralstonia sp. A12]